MTLSRPGTPRETLGVSTTIGAVIVRASGLYILYREARRR